MASSCLMCGASLVEEEVEPEEVRRGLPGWASTLIVVGLSIVILAAGAFGLHKLMTAEPREPAPTATPTRTPTATLSPTPTRTPTPTTIPTPVPPLVHQVLGGDTLSSIAASYNTTVASILAMNPGVEPENLQVGYILLIPAGTLTPTPTATLDPDVPTPTPGGFIVHVVESGDTLGAIAEHYGISVALIRAANPELQPGDDGAVLVGSEGPVLLQWASVSVLRDDEWYALSLFQSLSDTISSTIHTRTTAWRVPTDVLLAADGDVREFHWQVQVVREAQGQDGKLFYKEAGLPSLIRAFIWLEPTPTPTPTPTLTPSSTPVP
jgi:LysM repeat protein